MESIDRTLSGMDRRNHDPHLDQDIKTNMNWSDLKYFCQRVLELDKNIQETSLSKEHAVERRAKALKEFTNQ